MAAEGDPSLECPDVLVVVPAKDEQDLVGRCLRSCVAACAEAVRARVVRGGCVTLVAHRCSDSTVERAQGVLASLAPGVGGLVVVESVAAGPGGARAAGVRAALATWPHLGVDPGHTWLFSTDADSEVPTDWVVGTLAALADRAVGTVAAAGMVDLEGWEPSGAARAAYDAGIAAGLHGTEHEHVWGANLVVRLDAYLRVGGFADAHAEDRALLDALRWHGLPVTSTVTPVVRTSGRTTGRAPGGVADLLAAMSRAEEGPAR